MLVNKDAYQRETLTEWPIQLPLIDNRQLFLVEYFFPTVTTLYIKGNYVTRSACWQEVLQLKKKSNLHMIRPGKNVYFPASWAKFPSSVGRFPLCISLFFPLQITRFPSKELPILPIFSRPAHDCNHIPCNILCKDSVERGLIFSKYR